MMTLRKFSLTALVSVGGFSLLFSIAVPVTKADDDDGPKRVNCSDRKSLSSRIAKLKPGDILRVRGICNENVVVPANVSEVTIDGQGQTTIDGGAEGAALAIRGGNITVRNLTVTGGNAGILVQRGGSATIDTVVVQGVGTNGILINTGSVGRVVNSTIQNNLNGCGILVSENSSARIGFLAGTDTTASPNVIQGNDDGVCVFFSSNARVVGNNINGNTNHGVFVNTVSHAQVSSNQIDNNGGHGVQVGRNSGVNLGEGTGIFAPPNTTTTNNGQFGLRCFTNSYADGIRGTLNGISGQKLITGGCSDTTIP